MKISKKLKFLSSSAASLMSIGLAFGVSHNLLFNTNNKILTNNNNVSLHVNATEGVSPLLTSYEAYSGLQTITNRIGPMLISDGGKTFGNYDWYGNLNWSITLSNDTTGQYPNSGTKVVDWNYVSDKGYLYVITDNAYMFCVDSVSGNVIANASQSDSGIAQGSNKLATIALNSQLYVWNSNTQSPKVYSVDRTTLKQKAEITIASTNLSNKYLLNILELSNNVGFNIAITSTSAPTTTLSSVSACFVTNDLKDFTVSSGTVPTKSITLTNVSKIQDLYANAFYHSATNSYVLAVGNSLFNVILSTNAMEKSTFTDFTGTTSLNKTTSGFVDGNNEIYFTDSTKKIYSVGADGKSISQYYDLNLITYLSTDIKDVNTTVQIFPVQNSSGTLLQSQIFVATSKANFGGVSNKTAVGINNFNSSSTRPTINISSDEAAFKNLIPSAITYRNFVASNSDPLTSSSVIFKVDDKNGDLSLRATLSKQAWYTNVSEKTTSVINASYKLKTASEVTSWADQNAFDSIGGGYFKNKSPNQISTEDFDKYAEQVLIISPSLQSAVQSGSLKRTFVITEVGANNTIKVMATVSYIDQYGTFVTYSVKDQTYTVKSASSTKFLFQGQTSTYIEGQSLDVTTIGGLSNYKGFLPSLLSQDDLSNFIASEDGYPTSSQRRIITSTADDTNGTIKINVVYIGINPNTQNNFYITYTGFPTFNTSKIKWNGTTIADLLSQENQKTDESTKNQKLIDEITLLQNAYGEKTSIIDITTIASYVGYGSLLSTNVTTSQVNLVYTTLLSNMGFQPILTIPTLDDKNFQDADKDIENGVITIKLDYRSSKGTNGELLTSSFLKSLGIVTGEGTNQQVGVITQKFSGFLPIGSTYGVTLKDASSDAVKNVINNNNVDSIIPTVDLLSTLNIKGYNTDGTVDILNTSWNGEKLLFTVRAQSTRYSTVNGVFNFTLDWAPKFASIRERNLIIATVVSILGVAIVAGAIAAYVMRKNKIRRLLK
ncbi:MAG: hypothetical protein K2I67_01315 [Malacoplasma sp.]|nr:hypothetical protein [Malacoplasma sp.]